MKGNNLWNWIFGLFLLSIPLMFLGNPFVIGLIYLLICILDVVDGYKNNIRRDLRGYIVIILSFFISILFCITGILLYL